MLESVSVDLNTVEIRSLRRNHSAHTLTAVFCFYKWVVLALASGTVDMANPKLVLQGNSTGEILSKILDTREKISVPDPLVERIA
jgi:hypothetical protein